MVLISLDKFALELDKTRFSQVKSVTQAGGRAHQPQCFLKSKSALTNTSNICKQKSILCQYDLIKVRQLC